MDQDRTDWGAREYAEALNRATTPTDLFLLAQEVNEKWTTAGELGVRVASSESVDLDDSWRRNR